MKNEIIKELSMNEDEDMKGFTSVGLDPNPQKPWVDTIDSFSKIRE